MAKASAVGAGVTVGLLGVVGIVVCGAFLSGNSGTPEEKFPAPSVNTDWPDCDKDDRSPNWEVADCGPSPTARKPVITPQKTKAPAPKRTRR